MRRMRRWRPGWGWVLAGLLLTACGADDVEQGVDDGPACVGAKCDDPEGDTDGWTDEIARACDARRLDAFNPNRLAFTREALRWSCADIVGRDPSERGQEYCEYFAIVQLPNAEDSEVLGMLLGSDFSDGQTPAGLDLDPADIEALEDAPDAIVGGCVFTSWNADIDAEGSEERDLLGVPFTDAVFRMKLDANTNEAAQTLVEDCLEYIPPHGDPDDSDDPLHDPFTRACQLVADLEGTHDRKSDTIICGATVRMAECGCAVADENALASALAPQDTFGFLLGGWDGLGLLPPGCRFEAFGSGMQHVVVCDLSAAQVLQNAADLKTYCQQTFADDIVVHIPIAPSAVVCEPDSDSDPYAYSCSAEPWVLEP